MLNMSDSLTLKYVLRMRDFKTIVLKYDFLFGYFVRPKPKMLEQASENVQYFQALQQDLYCV